MMPGMDPKKMAQMMRQMGISQEEITARKVIIETDEGNLIVDNPNVVKITMQGSSSFQISGEMRMETAIRNADVRMVAEQAGVSEAIALQALKDANGDIASAIMALQNRTEGKE
jgi:nascent polypeptide-associated complex subunit alpha